LILSTIISYESSLILAGLIYFNIIYVFNILWLGKDKVGNMDLDKMSGKEGNSLHFVKSNFLINSNGIIVSLFPTLPDVVYKRSLFF